MKIIKSHVLQNCANSYQNKKEINISKTVKRKKTVVEGETFHMKI